MRPRIVALIAGLVLLAGCEAEERRETLDTGGRGDIDGAGCPAGAADGEPCTGAGSCTETSSCCSCGCDSEHTCRCQDGRWACTTTGLDECLFGCSDLDVVEDATPLDVEVEADAPDAACGVFYGYGGTVCTSEGERATHSDWCCPCGCELTISCTCTDGTWCCTGYETSDLCFGCGADGFDTIDPIDVTDTSEASSPDTCLSDAECRLGWTCEPWSDATWSCLADEDCPPDSVCDAGTSTCLARRCLESADCAAGAYCVEQRCRPQPGRCTAP